MISCMAWQQVKPLEQPHFQGGRSAYLQRIRRRQKRIFKVFDFFPGFRITHDTIGAIRGESPISRTKLGLELWLKTINRILKKTMRLPKADQSIVDIRKLQNYCLDPLHPRGKHKARVFKRAMNLTSKNAEELREEILRRVMHEEALLVLK